MSLEKRISAADWFREQLAEVKKDLPENYRQKLFEKRPDLDSSKGINRINNVITGRTTDLSLLNTLREIVAETKKGGQNAN